MGYSVGSNLDPAIIQEERELLLAGLNYREVADRTGRRLKSISERNRLVYKIDIWEAFQRRMERDGIPNRLCIGDDFGYWFSGLFDGEGCMTLATCPASGRPQYSEYRMHIRIMVRDDDSDMIYRIYDQLKVGSVFFREANGNANPAIAWRVENIKDLAEVIVPLFDRYPLHSKKAKEYALWRPIVMQRYITTMGSYSNRSGIPEEQRAAFHAAVQAIKDIRTYTRRVT